VLLQYCMYIATKRGDRSQFDLHATAASHISHIMSVTAGTKHRPTTNDKQVSSTHQQIHRIKCMNDVIGIGVQIHK
jgi:hypothetical protein